MVKLIFMFLLGLVVGLTIALVGVVLYLDKAPSPSNRQQSKVADAFDLSIRSLQSWEDVLTKLDAARIESEHSNKCEYDGITYAMYVISTTLKELVHVK